jgi:hypothetical protein
MKGRELLFPRLTPRHGKLSHNFSKQWGRYVRNRVGIKEPLISPAHSFRHFGVDSMYKALVPPHLIREFVGYAGKGAAEQRYAKGLLVGELREHCLPVIKGAVGPILEKLSVE